MKEIKGQLWDYYQKPNFIVCITTNGTIKRNGAAVMGRGCAKEAQHRNPNLPMILGGLIKANGNIVQDTANEYEYSLVSFPVKHNWWEDADLSLVEESAKALAVRAEKLPDVQFILPRPGCGNGNREWHEVKDILKILPDNVLVISR